MTTTDLIAQLNEKQAKAESLLTNWHSNTRASDESKAAIRTEFARLIKLGAKKATAEVEK